MDKNKYVVEFDAETHTYTVNGNKVKNVTQVIQDYHLGVDYSRANPENMKSHADKGRIVHSQIENYIKTGEMGFAPELDWFVNGFINKGYKVEKCEFIVANDCLGGTVDLCGTTPDGKKFIADVKTTSVVHKAAVSWQLSLYEYLDGEKYDEHLCVHLNNGCNIVPIDAQPLRRVESLVEAVRLDVPFQDTEVKDLVIPAKMKREIVAVQKELNKIDMAKKAIAEREKAVRDWLRDNMRECGHKKIITDYFTITYIAPTTRTSFDTKRFKAEHPEMWGDYQQTSNVTDSVRIELKGEE